MSSEPRLETSSSSHNALRPKRRSSAKKIKDAKQVSPQVPRSNTGNLHRSQVNHPSFGLTPQQWDFINNYPANFGGTNEHIKTKYITEIYDRATNRFIPTTCCY
jgi:hypothetical protein